MKGGPEKDMPQVEKKNNQISYSKTNKNITKHDLFNQATTFLLKGFFVAPFL